MLKTTDNTTAKVVRSDDVPSQTNSEFAYIYARRHAYDERFCLGTGKVNSLAGFTGAVLLALFALLTSVLAIFALLGGKYLGLHWLDPVMGVVGAFLVARWSTGLLRTTSRVLLDHQGPDSIRKAIRRNLEEQAEVTVADLHLWQIGPGIYCLAVSLIASDPRSPEHYRQYLPKNAGLAHVTIEVRQ